MDQQLREMQRQYKSSGVADDDTRRYIASLERTVGTNFSHDSEKELSFDLLRTLLRLRTLKSRLTVMEFGGTRGARNPRSRMPRPRKTTIERK